MSLPSVPDFPFSKIDPVGQALLTALKGKRSLLEQLLEKVRKYDLATDGFYRFYHQSFKVYNLQTMTLEVVEALQSVQPNRELHPWFMQIIQEGTGQKFKSEDNQRWPEVTRPILEAWFHTERFLEIACHYADSLEEAPAMMEQGWAAILYLYQMR